MPAYNADLEKFAGFDAQVVGISVDSVPSHIAWQKKDIGMLNYPLCSDFYPHGEVAKKFGVLRTGDPIPGINERSVFVIDKEGTIAFAKVYPLDKQPDNEDCFEVLRKL
ncbi:MAG: redoxin domain-containing protein [Candidatus Koribacter versatilis]|uniref:Alkyl hydroperoxide reductase C n=1 Tax=Candidatus Korobacter versatilis TaxID=658062 RepID=A0A932A7L3_9BACT|nr:redoxin domain-containing protein [Candidatus Koribacter versatilis]